MAGFVCHLTLYSVFCFIHSVFCQNWHQAFKSTSASCSILTIPCNYLHASESHHLQSCRPSINVTLDCFGVGKENHSLADVFRHSLFRRNEFRRNVDLDAAKHSDGYSTTKPQVFSPNRSRPTDWQHPSFLSAWRMYSVFCVNGVFNKLLMYRTYILLHFAVYCSI